MEIINFLKLILKIYLKFIVFSFPLALVSGPLIPDLIISLSSLFFLIFFYKEFFNLIKKNLFIKIFFFIFFIFSNKLFFF